MKLSVVIPVYNGEDFIQKSYNSIINQQLEDFELLYVNNNSKDASAARIQSLVEKDARVKLLHQPKQGTAAARNLGIQNTKGDYIYIFDVDDEIYPQALNKMIAVLDLHKDVDAVFGKMIKSAKGIAETQKPLDETHEVIFKEKPFWGLHWFIHLKDVVGPPAFLYRKTVFAKIGNYNEGIKNTEDTALDIKLGMTSNVAFIDTFVYLYFKHAASTIEMAKKGDSQIMLNWSRFVKSHLPFYIENEVPLLYKRQLYGYFYKTIAKQLGVTKGYNNRKLLKKQLLAEIEPIKLPWFLQLLLFIIEILPFSYLVKFYIYYIVPYYMNNRLEKL